MVQSVELLLDRATEDHIRGTWKVLIDAGRRTDADELVKAAEGSPNLIRREKNRIAKPRSQ